MAVTIKNGLRAVTPCSTKRPCCLLLLVCFAHSSILKMEVMCTPKTSGSLELH
jgi:hypothetical protein